MLSRFWPVLVSILLFSCSLSLCSLFPTPISLFLMFLVPHRILFLVLYVHCTNNSSSVSTETSLPAPRPSHSLFFSFLFPPLSFRLSPYLSLILAPSSPHLHLISLRLLLESRYYLHQDQRPLRSIIEISLSARVRNPPSSLPRAEEHAAGNHGRSLQCDSDSDSTLTFKV